MSPKVNCKQCEEELDTVHVYLEHLKRHKSEKRRPRSWTLTGLYKGFKRSMENAVLGLALFLGVLLIVVLVFEFRKNQPIVTPFDVPSDLKEFTGVTVAEVLIDKINDRISSAPSSGYSGVAEAGSGFGYQSARGREPVRFKRAGPEGLTIKMEVGGISLDSFVSYVKGIFGKESEVISGDIIKRGDSIKIIARTNKKGPWEEEGKEKDLEVVIGRLAEQMAFDMAPNYLEPGELARFYSDNRRNEEADIVYRKIVKDDPGGVEAYLEWARVLLYMWRDKEAEEKYQKAYEKACLNSNSVTNGVASPSGKANCAHVLTEWGIGLSIMGDSEGAIEKYEEAAEVDPENPEIYAQWGYELTFPVNKELNGVYEGHAGRHKEATQKFEEFVSRWGEPKNADFYNYWGTVLSVMGDYEMAIEKREKAVEIDPEYHLAYYYWGLDLYNWGRLYDNEAKFDEAAKKYRESISKFRQSLYVNPKYADAYHRLGVSFGTLGVNEDAIKQFQKAIQLDPKHPFAYSDLGYTLERLGRYGEAIEKYKEAIRVNPTYPAPYEGWVKSLEAMSKEGVKNGEVRKELAQAYYGWGWALDKSGRHDESPEKYEKAKRLGGDFIKSKTVDIGESPHQEGSGDALFTLPAIPPK